MLWQWFIYMSRKKFGNYVEGKSIIIKFKPIKKGLERFLPFCNNGSHRGLVENYELCEERKCQDYQKLFIN